MGTNQATNISKKLDRKDNNGEQEINNNDYFDSLTTFNKLCLAQNLLKEMYSLKERFEENKDKMIARIEQNCYKYYKNKLNSKEIYDYFESQNLEERINYKLTNNSKFIYENKIYRYFYDFLFVIKNNNSLILQIINKCSQNYYKDLSYFIVHFLYKDTCNCSFYQEELLLIIYLCIENAMDKSLPSKINSSSIKKDRDLYNNQLHNNFIYYLFYSLTRKSDIRNYLSSFLSDMIIKIEECRDNLSTEIKVFLPEPEDKKDQIKLNTSTIKLKRSQNLEKYIYELDSNNENMILKDNKRQKEVIRKSIITVKKKMSISGSIDFDEKINEIQKQDNKSKDDSNLEFISTDKIKIDSFFNNEDIAYTYIIEKLNFYENIKEKDKKEYAMIEYLDILLNEITKDGEPVEIYSTIVLKNELKMFKMNVSHEEYEKLINKLKSNYDYITSYICNLLIKIKDNLNSFPYSLKCIFKIINELFSKKIKNAKKGPYNYLLLIIKARIFFGCMIIPMLKNPDYSGIYTDGIISKITKDNLNIIVKILKVILSGSLFLVENAGYTIFNKFIIDTLPNIFEIIIDIDNLTYNFNLPDFINNLINDFPDNIINKERNINYKYFMEKKDERIQYQSLCFSWYDLIILINTIKNTKDIFNDLYKEEEKEIIENVITNKDYYQKILENYEENINKKTVDYFFITKILYQADFENKINAILKDNFEILFQGQINDEALRFKKCLTEVLAYVNYLKKEDFDAFIKRKKELTLDKNNEVNKYFHHQKEHKYENTNFEKKQKTFEVKNQKDLEMARKQLKKITPNLEKIEKSENDIDAQFYNKRKGTFFKVINDEEMKQDIDFKDIIFPRIYSKIMPEIYYNPEGNSQRIIFCISYIEEHINNLPLKYTENNFRQIFLDILKEPEKLIKELQYNILNHYHSKIRNCEKLNLISTKDSNQIKNMEKNAYTGYLFNKIKLNANLKINKNNKNIESVQLELSPINNKNDEMDLNTIQSFIDEMPNFRQFEINECIIDLEKKLKIDEIINNYFKEINNLVKNEKIISRFSSEEKSLIGYELENYVLYKLYDKLYPTISTKEDEFFYKKCKRLKFVKAENIIKNKKMINEKLLEISVNYMSEMDNKLTPLDKIKNFMKAVDILKNSMTFNSGKADLGLDDTLPFMIYIILKSKQQKIYTNFNYCNLFINPEFSKKQYGSMLTQLHMVMDIIKNMKHNELINISEEQFGKDE